MRVRVWVLVAAVIAGCGGGEGDDADPGLAADLADGRDAADAAASDPGAPDAAASDGQATDPGAPDAGAPDPGTPDPGTPDTGTPDTGEYDLAMPDPGLADPGPSDPGPSDPGSPADVPPPSLQPVSPAALHAEMAQKDFLLINVHIPYEGKIAGTDALIPYNEPDQLRAYLGDDRDVKAVLYCLSNYMSTLVGNRLVGEDGYRNLRYLDGGMGGWKAAGFPLEP